ncbi:universal stress protein [Flagellimonas crocea]|uniref:universal stress protein n=1 Tax=Flagellimonas crocea TaxID=3067311 RepID=UPI00296FBD06|nr:universal stress protein [Muricauda sp. DH64]
MLQILVPTDFSNNAYNALYYAAKLFRDKECSFHIVHVCSREEGPDGQEAQSVSKKELDALVHRLNRDVGRNKKHIIKKVSLCSPMAKGVAGYALENKVDLAIIGNKGKEEKEHILFGNNAMQLVREITCCPVLIVPLEIDFKKIDKMAFATNFAKPIAEESINTIQFFCYLMDSIVVPMSIMENNKDNDAVKNKTDFLKAIGERGAKEVILPVFKGKANTILEFVELWNIDMLCMIYYPHHFFLEFIGNGIIKELNTKLEVPFLILPNPVNRPT